MSRKNKNRHIKPWWWYGNKDNHGGGHHFNANQVVVKPLPRLPSIKFTCTKTASEKLKFWLDMADGEFGGFGITADEKQPFLITDFVLVAQAAGAGHTDLDDEGIADHLYNMYKKRGLQPFQCARIWFHKHPGNNAYYGPSPSGDDKATFKRCFCEGDWAAMLIFNGAYNSYAELYTVKGKAHNHIIGFEFWTKPLTKNQQAWTDEFSACVREEARTVAIVPVILPPKGNQGAIITRPCAAISRPILPDTIDDDIKQRNSKVLSGDEKLLGYLGRADLPSQYEGLTLDEIEYEKQLDIDAADFDEPFNRRFWNE
jgi:hypothetical protein